MNLMRIIINEAHPSATLMKVVGILIEKYEDENVSKLSVAEL